MSFILDALRKAESERNRNVAPVLMDARIAPPRRNVPAWAWVLGAVLLVNLGVLAWVLRRTPAPQAAAVPVAETITPAEESPAATAEARLPDAPAPVPPTPAGAPATPAAAEAAVPSPPAATPAAPHANGPSLAATGDEERLPQLQELRNAGVALPELVLDLHVYALAPANRSVLLNGQRAREGDYLPNGVKVERITPQAVILEAGGRRFRLAAGE